MTIPHGLEVESFGGVGFEATPLVETTPEGAQFVLWRSSERREPGARVEYFVQATVEPVYHARTVQSQATVFVGENGASALVDVEQVEISIIPKGRYLKHLPGLYENDDFIGRFLMLFESHWAPIEGQISGIHNYFDPKLAPTRMLSWLAMWVDLRLDENWSEAKQRRLLTSIIRLYRKRGTKAGLQEYLEIFSEGRVEISERRANNFRLGPQARLGVGIALGTANVPHTFAVKIWLPPIETQAPKGATLGAEELQRFEHDRRRVIRAIIEAEKPAHTTYQLEFVGDESAAPESANQ
ncbi:MAG: hypothetical protein HC802_21135 [Caldilineaceae bacterium]|nr:hypothetical protein [Caldilineaceae bacterium]